MLLATYDPQGAQNVPYKEILNHISALCRAQNHDIADHQFFVHWSRHLLSNIRHWKGKSLDASSSLERVQSHTILTSLTSHPLTLRTYILEQSQNGLKYPPSWSS